MYLDFEYFNTGILLPDLFACYLFSIQNVMNSHLLL